MNLFICQHLETNLSHMLSDTISAFMIASFSVSYLPVPLVFGWALQAIGHLKL